MFLYIIQKLYLVFANNSFVFLLISCYIFAFLVFQSTSVLRKMSHSYFTKFVFDSCYFDKSLMVNIVSFSVIHGNGTFLLKSRLYFKGFGFISYRITYGEYAPL